jgi:hypothetical protein
MGQPGMWISSRIDGRSAVEAKTFARRTPVFSVLTGQALFSLTLPERLRAEHVELARVLAEQARAYAAEVERLYRNGPSAGRRVA